MTQPLSSPSDPGSLELSLRGIKKHKVLQDTIPRGAGRTLVRYTEPSGDSSRSLQSCGFTILMWTLPASLLVVSAPTYMPSMTENLVSDLGRWISLGRMQNRRVIQILKALCHVSVDVLKGYPAPPLGRDGDDPCRGGAEQQPS